MNKRGQFFILTAVIFSTLLFSISLTVNQAVVKDNNNNFYEYSSYLNREVKYVQDLQAFEGEIDEDQIQDFIGLVSNNLQDKNPNINFMFIYGNSSKLSIKNYGAEEILLGNEVLKGSRNNNPSQIRINIGTLKVPSKGDEGIMIYNDLEPNTHLEIVFNDQSYDFTIPEYNIVIFLMQEEVEDEIFIDIK